MKVSQKLKVAVTCLAIAGFTVACNDKSKPAAPKATASSPSSAAAPADVKEVEKSGELSAEEIALAAAAARIEARQLTASQLQSMIDGGKDCDSSDQVIADNTLDLSVTSHSLNGVGGVQIGSIRLLNTINDVDSLECQADVISKVAKAVKIAYVDSQMNDFSSVEENADAFGKANTFLATVTPAWNMVNAKMFARDRSDSVEEIFAQTDEHLEAASKSLNFLQRRADQITERGMAVENTDVARQNATFARTYAYNLKSTFIQPARELLNDLQAQGRRPEANAAAELKMAADLAKTLKNKEKFIARRMKLVKLADLQMAAIDHGYGRPAPVNGKKAIQVEETQNAKLSPDHSGYDRPTPGSGKKVIKAEETQNAKSATTPDAAYENL